MSLGLGLSTVGFDAGLAGDEAEAVFADFRMIVERECTVDGGLVDETTGEFAEADAIAGDVSARAGKFDLEDAEPFAVGEGKGTELKDAAGDGGVCFDGGGRDAEIGLGEREELAEKTGSGDRTGNSCPSSAVVRETEGVAEFGQGEHQINDSEIMISGN
jgi:hypothetical protein